MLRLPLSLLFLCLVFLSVPTHSTQVSVESYTTHQELEYALLNSVINQTVPNLYILTGTFFPIEHLEPICLPVTYRLHCDTLNICSSGDCIDCTTSNFNASFLWTEYDTTSAIGKILLSYAKSGIELLGFSNWEETCVFGYQTSLQLNVTNLTYADRDVVMETLKKITARLKNYAANDGKPKVGESSNNGYAVQWNEEDITSFFEDPDTLLTVEFAFLNIFIFFLSIAMTTYSYDILYKNVKRKKNPGYPIFWGLVVFSLCFNVGTPWVILLRPSIRVGYSLAVMIPLELLVAFLVKKKSNFPIPGMSPHGCTHHGSRDHFTWELLVLTCCRCLVNHVVQVLAIWSILISITLLVYYLSSIVIAFYLYPTLTLIKVVFVKGIAVCTILIFALVFSQSKFKFDCTCEAFKNNVVAVLSLLTVVSFLPILAYITFVVGGILFYQTTPNNSLQSILTLLPSAFLLFVAWFSRGHLFPKGLHSTDPAKEIASDLEEGATNEEHKDDKGDEGSDVQVPMTPTPGAARNGELSSYNSLDQRKPLSLQASLHGSMDGGEHQPLLPN